MNGEQHVDRLGNPVYRPAKPGLQQRVIRWASVVTTIVICLGIMAWGR